MAAAVALVRPALVALTLVALTLVATAHAAAFGSCEVASIYDASHNSGPSFPTLFTFGLAGRP